MINQRVAIVTGSARGIGAAITTSLARSGVHVAAGYSTNSRAAEELAGNLSAEGASVSVHQGNVGVPADCERVVGEVLADRGRIDYLINNAGITVDKTMRKMTVDDWHAVLRINLSAGSSPPSPHGRSCCMRPSWPRAAARVSGRHCALPDRRHQP